LKIRWISFAIKGKMERATGIEPVLPTWESKLSILYFQYLQNHLEKMYVHATHTVHALPDLRVAGERLGDDVSSMLPSDQVATIKCAEVDRSVTEFANFLNRQIVAPNAVPASHPYNKPQALHILGSDFVICYEAHTRIPRPHSNPAKWARDLNQESLN